MPIKDYEFRIFEAGSTTVETTIASSNMRAAPTIRTQRIDYGRMRTQSQPWQVDVNDDSDFFSALVADSGGRMVLLGRVADVRVASNSTTFSTIATGRISDIIDHVSHYTVTVQDERYLERKATIFTQQGIAPGSGSSSEYIGNILYPAGLEPSFEPGGTAVVGSYGPWRARDPTGQKADIADRRGNLIFVKTFGSAAPQAGLFWNEEIRNLINEDVVVGAIVSQSATVGNFENLRANIDGTDYEIASFDSRQDSTAPPAEGDLLQTVDTIVQQLVERPLGAWIVDSAFALSTGGSISSFYLHAETMEPSEVAPLHIGGLRGIPPGQALKNDYDEIGIRYSSAAMQSFIDDASIGRAHWRVTEPQNAAKFHDDNIYGAYGYLPLVNQDGEVVPTKAALPQEILSTDLFEFTESNTVVEPTWHQVGRDMITAIKYETIHEGVIGMTSDAEWPADGLLTVKRTLDRTHDRLDSTQLPRREITVALNGLHTWGYTDSEPERPLPDRAHKLADYLSEETFQRFGDGPIVGELVATSTGESVAVGENVRITIPTFPAPDTQGRGATRIVTITGQELTPAGPSFSWLDAGPNLAPVTTPTLSAFAAATSDPLHALSITIGGATAGASYQLQLARGASAPSSSDWFDWYGVFSSSGTYVKTPVASNTTWYVRGRTAAQGRIRSAWTTTQTSTATAAPTSAITTPSALASSSITAASVNLDWAVGDPAYALELLRSTAGGSTATNRMVLLGAGSIRYEVRDLTADSTFLFGIRHFDEYGGVSAQDTLSVQLTTSVPTAPDINGIALLVGNA